MRTACSAKALSAEGVALLHSFVIVLPPTHLDIATSLCWYRETTHSTCHTLVPLLLTRKSTSSAAPSKSENQILKVSSHTNNARHHVHSGCHAMGGEISSEISQRCVASNRSSFYSTKCCSDGETSSLVVLRTSWFRKDIGRLGIVPSALASFAMET